MSDATSKYIFGSDNTAMDKQIANNAITNMTAFRRAVVIETLCDPSIRNAKEDLDIVQTLKNPGDYEIAPRNSIICRIVGNGEGLVENSDYVCFPFFSSHLMMPAKAGEQVWVFFEKPDTRIGRPYWVSRICEPIFVEDANFTHGDRKIQKTYIGTVSNDKKEDGSGNFLNPRKLAFQNGNPDVASNATISGGQESFFNIIQNSRESILTSFEPVPRVTKRPGDFVLQGSNNTLIRLGTSMSWNALKRPLKTESTSIATPENSPSNFLETGLGTIDIVTGRGKIYQDFSAEKSKDKTKGESTEKSTRPIIEQNDLDAYETDKNIATQQKDSIAESRGNLRSNPQEGDPDYLLDDSRILLSSKIEIDKEFGTGPDGVATKFENPITDLNGAAIAMKSDHIRIVARKNGLQKNSSNEPADAGQQNPQTNGSIRIIKEGEKNADLASITIEADGSIHISGSKIFIGRKTDDGGVGTGPGPGESQPYVKYQQLEDLLNKTYDDLKTFVQKLQANFNTNTTPGFGGPNPALIKSAADECTQFLSAIKSRKNEIQNLKSERIFGE